MLSVFGKGRGGLRGRSPRLAGGVVSEVEEEKDVMIMMINICGLFIGPEIGPAAGFAASS